MAQSKKLSAGITRNNREMADGRIIRYYDTGNQTRSTADLRPKEDQPDIGELRLDPLVNEWVAMAAHRQGRIFLPPKELCPLCPTTGELLTEIPESDFEVVVFDNRSPSLRPPIGDWALPDQVGPDTDLGTAAGKCEVICFTPDHGKSFKDLAPGRVRVLLEAWIDRTEELSREAFIEHIAPFENRGEEIGVTLSHPHGQIYAYSYLPPRVEKMLAAAKKYKESNGKVLFDEVIAREIRDSERIIARNDRWIAFVPYASRYPFEIHVAPLNPVADLTGLTEADRDAFPEIALEVMKRLDGVFGIDMAYIAAWHQAPVRTGRDLLRLHWQITSVRRAPGKLKYLAGSESAMGAFIMDMRPEQSAAQLRDVKL
ncbi:MAG: galactose-1-phosphate uridylyltransferase [Actinobacteria bacterium]|uniref:UDP-glucose--hexose-1-phosphate uridylyltransferase n=1 Tax=freshwater metagenome TaxID=449393 RepID=A0A6J6WED2_9ZZZZ|nr:galactose-1-phosphate uridylyltransferase [Actinomycetota bacterium]MSY36125.1 galactose-1-phosphate uridylyltransferase [Actinomycetota bacterium]MTA72363.1 galactose-1-phosphate uridylyltransferase [Actinomycetota bacterium]MTB29516.1 galactose-1-phosphate uridylyltransferase [Actinomycetota bacterium]MUH49109.1 galactose-1-phosphate uridylyltransferase [Actinomycetota bacterium]